MGIKKIKGTGRGFFLNYNDRPFSRSYRPGAKIVVIRDSRTATPETRTRFGDETAMSKAEVDLGKILTNPDSTRKVTDELTDDQCAAILRLITGVAAGIDPAAINPVVLVTQDDPVIIRTFETVDLDPAVANALDIAAYGHIVEKQKPAFGNITGKASAKPQKAVYKKKSEVAAEQLERKQAQAQLF